MYQGKFNFVKGVNLAGHHLYRIALTTKQSFFSFFVFFSSLAQFEAAPTPIHSAITEPSPFLFPAKLPKTATHAG